MRNGNKPRRNKTKECKDKNAPVNTITAGVTNLTLNDGNNSKDSKGKDSNNDTTTTDTNTTTDTTTNPTTTNPTITTTTPNNYINIATYLKNRLPSLKASLPHLKSSSTTAHPLSQSPLKLLLKSNHYNRSDRIRITGNHSNVLKIVKVKGNVIECDGDCVVEGVVRVDDERYRMRRRVVGEIEWVVGKGLMGCVDVCGDGVDVYGDEWINCEDEGNVVDRSGEVRKDDEGNVVGRSGDEGEEENMDGYNNNDNNSSNNGINNSINNSINNGINNSININNNINKNKNKTHEKEINDASQHNIPKLNASQNKALSMCTSSLKILGPPGTGKTYTLIHIIKKLLNDGKRVLVCAPSNLALDNLRRWFSEDECVRIGGKSKFRNYEDIARKEKGRYSKDGDRSSRGSDRGSRGSDRGSRSGDRGRYSKDGDRGSKGSDKGSRYSNKDKDKNKYKDSNKDKNKNRNKHTFHKTTKKGIANKTSINNNKGNIQRTDYALLRNYDLVFSTLYSLYKIRDVYDMVIVDECCQADEDELVMVFFKGRNVILAGDPYQLGPVDEGHNGKNGCDERSGDESGEGSGDERSDESGDEKDSSFDEERVNEGNGDEERVNEGSDNNSNKGNNNKDNKGKTTTTNGKTTITASSDKNKQKKKKHKEERKTRNRRYKTMAQVRKEINNCMFNRIRLPTVLLNVQYRMPANLIAFSNRFFYRNMLRSVQPLSLQFFDHSNLMLINTAHRNFLEHKDVSIINVEEGKLVIAILSFIDRTYNVRSIGVITPYAAQAQHIMRSIDMSTFRAHVQISTVDSFQGQERDVVVISMVRSNWEKEIGFMDDVRRMNVAMTRCRMGMVMVGDKRCFEWVFYRRVFEFFEGGVVLGPEQFYSLVEQ
ncbi:DNA helicase [Trachipleistophora hominis]|uniref:DNA helicase n=1 Tax=Trachipleistophora hominis TaxID=72359 RepID=L7JYK9_TRAHO|nr:DNA helicase [Trachipleistophora hominis]